MAFKGKKRDKAQDLKTATQIMRGQLGESGISAAMAKALEIAPLAAADLAAEGGPTSNAFRIRYFSPEGKPNGFCRYRLLEEQRDHSFKYFQRKDTAAHVYFPPYLPRHELLFRWPEIAQDPDIPVYITEGEKKAICACMHGLPTLGLGGVWSFKSKKRKQDLIPELNAFEWRKRQVTLIYDSDIRTNPDVASAADSFSDTLMRRGAIVHRLELPDDDPSVKGIDDHIMHYGIDEVLGYPTVEVAGSAMWDMNQDIAVVSSYVINLEDGDLMDKGGALLKYNNRLDEARQPIFNEWLKWEHRRTYERLTFAPGRGREVPNSRNKHGYPEYNTYEPPTVVPKKGSVKPWKDFLRYLVAEDKEALPYLIWWCAFKVAFPDQRLTHSVVLHSIAEGTGKSLFFQFLRPLIGERQFTTVSADMVESAFNGWARGKLLVVLEESQDSYDRKLSEKLKDLKTADRIQINEKNRRPYEVPNYVTMGVTSNRQVPMHITAEDRRHFVVHTAEKALPEEEYEKLTEWYELRGGREALMYFLLHDVDLNAYNPRTSPPITRSKRELAVNASSPIEEFLHTLANSPEELFEGTRPAKRELWTSTDLLPAVEEFTGRRFGASQLGKAIRRLGFKNRLFKIALGKKVTTKRMWAVRNSEFWLKDATTEDFEKHYNAYIKKGHQ